MKHWTLMLSLYVMLTLYASTANAGSDCNNKVADDLDTCLLNHQWTREHSVKGITVYMRHKGEIYELFMKTRINAPAAIIYRTLADFNRYTEFMPRGLNCSKVMVNNGDSLYAWQRINFNWFFNIFIDDQFYLIDVSLDDDKATDHYYRVTWKLGSDSLHQRHRATGRKCTEGEKIKSNIGYWEISGQKNGQSEVNYYAYLTPSGRLAENLGSLVAWVTREAAPKTLLKLKQRVE